MNETGNGEEKPAGVKNGNGNGVPGGHGFSTWPVFLASISTILGAILFLRFGYAVGNLGLVKALLLVLLGHMVTIPTALAIAEISTNRRVEGGGEYYIISRSFGPSIGGAIGTSLYLSRAISVAFYMIAFAEVFSPLLETIRDRYDIFVDPRMISMPATLILLLVVLRKGAAMGVRALWGVSLILLASLGLFFLGEGELSSEAAAFPLFSTVDGPAGFLVVFAICFPAFTGITAGVGLSGDLKNPSRSIPLGTLAATLGGLAVYTAVVFKLALNATPEALAGDQFIMAKIAPWAPIVYIGLGAATLSSAIGSILVAPRILQALARDRVLPIAGLNGILAQGRGEANEPARATIFSGILALGICAIGDINIVAPIITMFFLITYGALCSVSFLSHFAANPSYRPSFRSRWYLSLLGAVLSFMIMFLMEPLIAPAALLIMVAFYLLLRLAHKGERDLTAIFQGVMFQLTRWLQVALQQTRTGQTFQEWRPSVLAISRHTLDRLSQYNLLRWICKQHGFGHYVQYVEGEMSPEIVEPVKAISEKLIQRNELFRAGIYVGTVVAPTYRAGLAQLLQLPSMSGLPSNSVLLEFPANRPEEFEEIREGAQLAAPLGYNLCILRSAESHFGYRRNLHIWLTQDDFNNGPLMILLSYVILGHPDWAKAEAKLFACFPVGKMQKETEQLKKMIAEGRLPISERNVTPIAFDSQQSFERAAAARSSEADLVIVGLTQGDIMGDLKGKLMAHSSLSDVLFVYANEKVPIQ